MNLSIGKIHDTKIPTGRTLHVVNEGTLEQTFSVSADQPFLSVGTGTLTIAPGASASVDLVFTETPPAGPFAVNVTIATSCRTQIFTLEGEVIGGPYFSGPDMIQYLHSDPNTHGPFVYDTNIPFDDLYLVRGEPAWQWESEGDVVLTLNGSGQPEIAVVMYTESGILDSEFWFHDQQSRIDPFHVRIIAERYDF